MKLTQSYSVNCDEQTYELRLDGMDMVLAKFSGIDHELLQACEASPRISDKLLALHAIALRIEEIGNGTAPLKELPSPIPPLA